MMSVMNAYIYGMVLYRLFLLYQHETCFYGNVWHDNNDNNNEYFAW